MKQFFRRLLRRNMLGCLIFSVVVCFCSGEQLSFAIAGKCFGLLVGRHGTKAKINHPAKLGKKKNNKRE